MPKAAPPAKRSVKERATPAVDISTFPNAVRYLLERVDFERQRLIRYDTETFKLDRMRKLLDLLGNPHEQVKMVHVAGTVGKGSTVAMIAAMLQGCGYAVGQYTSPHVVDIRERIAINGQPIGRTEFTESTRQIAGVVEKLDFEPTFFEMMTALAFKHFAEQAVDIAVVEVGLGGRLDSTNVITPLVSVITQIDFDHMQLLGRTLEKIAQEKAGIMKRGVPVITVEQPREADLALQAAAERVCAPLHVINRDVEFSFRFGATDDRGPHTRVCIITATSQFMHLPVPLPGEHQAYNCALALAAIDVLKSCGFNIPEAAMHDGLAKTYVPGRMELVWSNPKILVDGAHNAAALGALMRSVGAHVPYDSMVCIFGCCEDKDIPAMLEKVSLGGDKVIFTRARSNARAADPEELQRKFAEQSGKMSQVARGIGEALNLAQRAVGRDDLICVTGSFYLVGDTKKYLSELDKKHLAAATK
jgi:dihydrofolate synthase/folylpolyglutamate synthase